MKIELDVDEKEVVALRSGGQVPLSLRDKLGDAVAIRDVGWYVVQMRSGFTTNGIVDRVRWWNGVQWAFGPEAESSDGAQVDSPDDAQRLYLADEI